MEDYKYEDGVLSAKIYVASANPSKGLVQVGEYEVTGSWSLTADEVEADGHRFVPFVQVETWNNGGWAAAGRVPGASYTATDSAKVRLTYTWLRKRGLTLIVR